MDLITAEIIKRCKEGDKEAFAGIVRRYRPMLFSLSLKMLCDEEDAKDVVQDAFLNIWQKIDDFREENNLTTWIYTLASRLCIDRLRFKKRCVIEPKDEILFRNFIVNNDFERELDNREWVAIVKILVGRLPAKQRLVFTLCRFEGLSLPETEKVTGMNVAKIKSNLYVANKTIREKLKNLGYEQFG